MTDDQKREMLKAAARAAGLNNLVWTPGTSPLVPSEHRAVPDRCCWNPLADDGDALRLAVTLGISINHYPIFDMPKFAVLACEKGRSADAERDVWCEDVQQYDDNPCAATRLAITRVAAEIGRQMQSAEKGACDGR